MIQLHRLETNTGQKTALRFLSLNFLRFLESSFSPIKLPVLMVETISFPVSFPFVSRFHAIGCDSGNEV